VLRFEPKHRGDLRTRWDELWATTGGEPYPASVRGEVLDLVRHSRCLLQFDAIGDGYMMRAANFLNHSLINYGRQPQQAG
jgi:hypothetical protein